MSASDDVPSAEFSGTIGLGSSDSVDKRALNLKLVKEKKQRR